MVWVGGGESGGGIGGGGELLSGSGGRRWGGSGQRSHTWPQNTLACKEFLSHPLAHLRICEEGGVN